MTRLGTVALGVVLLVPVGAGAQTAPAPARPRPATARPRAPANGAAAATTTTTPPSSAPAAPVPVPSTTPERDLTISITAEPPAQPPATPPGDEDETETPTRPGAPRYPAGGYPTAAYPPAGGYVYATPPPTPPLPSLDTPAMVAASWTRHFVFGATLGVASPLGVLGAWLDVNVARWIGFTGGFGTGGTFGPAIALGVNVRPIFIGRFAFYGTLGLSTNFVLDPNSTPGLRPPNNSWWFNPEIGFEFRARNGFFLRVGVGWGVMLNTGDFRNVDVPGMYGPDVFSHPLDRLPDPIAAADAHDRGQVMNFPFIHLDLGYVTGL